MNFESIKIKGFRNIKEIELSFSNLITALVSHNNYGKSNVIDAIDFIVDFIKASPEKKQGMMAAEDCMPFNKKTSSLDFFTELILSTKIAEREFFIEYGFEFIWAKDDNSGQRIINEWMRIKDLCGTKLYNRFINRTGPYYRSSEKGRCSTPIKVKENELILNKLLEKENLYYNEIIEKLNKISVYVEKHYNAAIFFGPSIITLKSTKNVDINKILSIPRTMYYLKAEYQDKYYRLVDAFLQLFPSITDINLESKSLGDKMNIQDDNPDVPYKMSDVIYRILVTDRYLNQPIDMDMISEGAKKVFLMLMFAVMADIEGLSMLIIEEPENSIHPKLLQSFLNIVRQLSGNSKILVSSHSPYILQYINTGDIYIGLPNNVGIASFLKIDTIKVDELLKDAYESEATVGEYIFDLLSGEDDDIDVLSEYLEQ